MSVAGGEQVWQRAEPDGLACADEPVHIPGKIQPHGVLFALDESSLRIDQVSENALAWFDEPAERLLGRDLRALFTSASGNALSEALRAGIHERLTINLEDLRGVQHEAQLHHAPGAEGVLIAELSPPAAVDADFHPRLRASLTRLQQATSLQQVWRVACSELRALTGFDRVLVLLFEDDWSGQVVAEARAERLDSLLGERFAEHEIPAQVRRLYAEYWLRLVADVHASPSPLVPRLHPRTGQPLDLSCAYLRSFSPAHIAYLRQHDVAASMSVSLVVDGKLRGLLACRHYAGAHHVSRAARDAAELLGQLLSFQLRAHEASESTQRQLQERVRSADQAKEVFIANVSHELRTPLNAITGWTRMLQLGAVPSERIPHAIEVIARNAQAQTQLVDDLIAVSGMATGQLPLACQPLDLCALLESVLASVRLHADSRLIRLESSLLAGCWVLGDQGWLKQVALQLLSNALKFTPRGGRVHVSLVRIERDVELTISDSGQGIAAEFLPRLFAPFRQQDEGPSRHQQGLGLGLSMVQQLVELHGGDVSAESEGLNRGARFRVRLPAHAPAG